MFESSCTSELRRQKNYLKLVGQFREVTEIRGDTVDDQIHDDSDEDDTTHNDAKLLKTKDPRSSCVLIAFFKGCCWSHMRSSHHVLCPYCCPKNSMILKKYLARKTRMASERTGELDPDKLTGFAKFKYNVVENCVQLVTWKHFDLMSSTLILINCLVLCEDHYPMNQGVENGLSVTNAVLTVLFLFEMLLLLTAKGPVHYTSDAMNSFDAFVVIASCIDLAIEPPAIFGTMAAIWAV